MIDIRKDVPGLWCDDITFCQEKCTWKSCPRNQENIRDRTIPHSFCTEIPGDCPKRVEMAHREHVIKALEEAIPFIDSRGYGGVAEIMHDALSMLKEQEAVPVIQREIMHMLVWCCGSCGVAITDGDKFCRMCGKKVKWD